MSSRTFGISFDVWDTLVTYGDTRNSAAAARASYLAELMGCAPSAARRHLRRRYPEELPLNGDSTVGIPLELRTQLLLNDISGRQVHFDVPTIARHLSKCAVLYPPRCPEGITSVLERMADEFPHALASNTRWTSGADLSRILDLASVNLKRFFVGGAFSDVVGFAKPSKCLFNAAWESLVVDSRSIVHVGDDVQTDVVGAQAAGARAVLCRA